MVNKLTRCIWAIPYPHNHDTKYKVTLHYSEIKKITTMLSFFTNSFHGHQHPMFHWPLDSLSPGPAQLVPDVDSPRGKGGQLMLPMTLPVIIIIIIYRYYQFSPGQQLASLHHLDHLEHEAFQAPALTLHLIIIIRIIINNIIVIITSEKCWPRAELACSTSLLWP